jgi:hypothetical protein
MDLASSTIMAPEGLRRPFVEGDSLDFGHPLIWTQDQVLRPEECSALIAKIEAVGCVPAPITTARGFEMRPDVRNNTRAMFDDPEMAGLLFQRVRDRLPARMCLDMTPIGANERFRCYRYERGERFAPHYDGAFIRDANEESLLTFMIYLNEEFEGGETNFLDFELSIRPRTGLGLFFQHRLLHEGAPIISGKKYVVRSDIMYRRALSS